MNRFRAFVPILLMGFLPAAAAHGQTNIDEVRYQAQQTVRYIDNMESALRELQPGDLSPQNMAAFNGHMAEMTRAADQLRAALANPNQPAPLPPAPRQGQSTPPPVEPPREHCDPNIPSFCDLPFVQNYGFR